jgi:phage tail sheath protein FI
MALQPTYPGVYIEEIPSGVRTITGVSTSIAVFIDYFRRGPMNRAVRIFSFGDFEREFGGLDTLSEASYAIQQFFLNGGSQAYVIRVAAGTPLASSVSISHVSPAGGEVLIIRAINEGDWGNRIRIKIDHNTNPVGLFNMVVSEYDRANTPVWQETYLGLSMDNTSANYVRKVINDPNQGSKIIRVGNIDSLNLPAANGTVSGEHPDIRNVGISSSEPKLSIVINGAQVPVTVTLAPPSTASFQDRLPLSTLALILENAIRKAAPSDPTLSKASVSVSGNRLHVLAGGNTSGVILTFRNFNGDTTADQLLLTDAATPNIQEYVLGVNENESFLISLPAWNGATEYNPGDVVVESNVAYLCFTPHVSTVHFNDENWQVIPLWEAATQYEVNDVVMESNNVYRRDGTPQLSEESFNEASWSVITPQQWQGQTYYAVGAVVVESGRVFRCRIGHHASTVGFNDDSNDANWVEIAQLWEEGRDYSEGDFVLNSDTLFRCVVGHPAVDFDTEAEAGNWDEIRNLPIGWNSAQISGVLGNNGTPPDTDAILGTLNSKTGMYALEDVDLFNIMCIPRTAITTGTHPISSTEADTVMSTAIEYCRQKRAFYIMDTPLGINELSEIINWMAARDTLRSDNAAIYYPRVLSPDPLDNYRLRSFGASGTIAGLYARTDSNRGIWKAPAGTEANLRNVSQLDDVLNDRENGVLNPLGINCLRTFPVYGNICWGGRTLVGADANASEWKYIPVRRLAYFLEESLFRALHWVVFEANDESLWAQIRLNVGAFMNNLFKQGAFQGTSPREAYLVKCDRETTTQNDINLGIVNVLVGFAPLKPAEFVFIKIQQLAGQIQT